MTVQTQHGGSHSRLAVREPGGFVVWLTGLPAAGKTTIAKTVAPRLEARGLVVDQLDGDVIRTHLSSELGFSREDRDKNVARIAWVSSRLARAGVGVLVSAVSPYEQSRRAARALVEGCGTFVEVHVATPVVECVRRDPKGLYAEALAGRRPDFTGVSAPYEVPESPELRIDTTTSSPDESADQVIACLERLSLLPHAARAFVAQRGTSSIAASTI
jgi:adenylyl-sulfate kinase